MRLFSHLITWILFLYSFFPISSSSSNHLCLEDQSSSLLQFKQSFSINHSATVDPSGYPKVRYWKPDTDCCSWDGVTCHRDTGHVIRLELNSSLLYGPIDSKSSLFHLHDLQVLNLADNHFKDSQIPSAFGRLTNLTHLNLSFSVFSGQIPLQISQLLKLVSLDLSRNDELKLENPNLRLLTQNLFNLKELRLDELNMSAEVNSDWCKALSLAHPNLRVLSLSRCSLSGPIDISLLNFRFLSELSLSFNNFSSVVPDFLGNLTSLIFLHLSGCEFFGKLPRNIFQLPNLQALSINSNPIDSLPEFPHDSVLQNLDFSGISSSGKLPNSIGNLKILKKLNLNNCNFSGLIPSSLSNLTQLEELDLSINNFDLAINSSLFSLPSLLILDISSNNLSGLIPSSLSNLTQLIDLDLSGNNFEGAIHSSLFFLPSLLNLDLSGNNLVRVIHSSHSFIPTLQNLYLSSNNFSGSILSILENLTQLIQLDLSFNSFEGAINSSLFFLPSLQKLDLSFNNFEGAINSSLFFLPSLQNLDLSHNNLARIIHSSQFFIPTLQKLDLSSNNFSGSIPSPLTNLTQLVRLDLSNNNFEGAVHSYLFFLPSLQSIDLSGNQLTTIIEDFHTVNSSSVSLLRLVCLDENRLKGTIPRLVFHLTSLEVLLVSSNDFNESVGFNMLQNLKNLTTLDISYNNFSFSNNNGENFTVPQLNDFYAISCNFQKFPIFLENQNHLQYLSLSSNRINGKIPKWIWKPDMFELNLSRNLISGLESPPSICNAIYIVILDLSNNQLSGKIPECPATFGQSLDILNLGENKFHGTIPQICVNGSYLSWLNINNNQLDGQLPRSLANCSWLEVLDLGNNKINDTFPFWLENLTNLRVLVLRSNKFHGSIQGPRTSHAFPMLHIIDLSFNNFTGSLPSEYFKCWKAMMMVHKDSPVQENIWDIYISSRREDYYQVKVMIKGQEMEYVRILTVFTTIDLSYNRFQWEIPEVIGDLTLLKVLNLSGNCLTGKIPSSLGHLIQLESLDLSRNQISGKIPLQLTNLTFLSFLNLSQNQLVGPIPGGKQFDTFENTSYEGNSGLCGFPLSRTCGTIDSTSAPASKVPQQNQDSTTVLDFKFVLMGYGCGVIIGFIIGGQVPSWRIDGLFKITSRKRGLKLKK